MIKHSEFDFAYDYLRLDSTWKFEWNVNEIANDTRRLYPFTEVGENKTWWFKGNSTATIKHDEFVWNPAQPYLEYDNDNELQWDASHPENQTRYLCPGASYVKLTNTVETVIIDNIPPDYVSDKGTEYIVVHYKNDKLEAARHCEYIFRDMAGLDYHNFSIKVGKGEDAVLLYEYKRKYDYADSKKGCVLVGIETDSSKADYREEKQNYAGSPLSTIDNPFFDEDHIDPDSVKVSSDGYNTYKITFDLIDNPLDDVEFAECLTNEGLTIEVWDKAGNTKEYTFGRNEEGKFRKTWRYIDSLDDVSELQPCIIKFFDKNPENMAVDENSEGSVWVSVYNPNKDFLFYIDEDWNMDIQLSDGSIGVIDTTTIDDSRYCPVDGMPEDPRNEGIISFKVINIKKYGNVEVEAWLKTGNKNFDDFIKTSTFATDFCGPWLCIDEKGRKYNLKTYVPKYLRQSDYYDFVKFFELYLNTLYTDLTKGTNISILEKIAKIGDFNDIDKIEHCLMYHYAKHYGSEFDIDLQTMLDLNLGFYAEGALATRTEDDVLDIIRYALKNLPYYNQIKGTNNGMVMALKMFSLSCKIINCWCKKDPPIEKKADFLEEDRLYNVTSYFLTSRFNIEFNSLNVDFQTFNASLDVFIKFVKGIKPITRILNLIKYTVIFEKNLYWTVNQFIADDSDLRGDLIYKIIWDNTVEDHLDSGFLDEMYEKTKIDWNTMHTERMWIPFNCSSCDIHTFDENAENYEGDDTDIASFCNLSNVYTLLCQLVANSDYRLIFGYSNNYDVKFVVKATQFYVQGEFLNETTHTVVYKYCTWTDESKTDYVWETNMSNLVVAFDTYASGMVWMRSQGFPNECHAAVVSDIIKVRSGEIKKTLMFNKTVNMNDLTFEMMETGMFIYPKNGETSTSLAEFVKPTYYVDNLLTKEAKSLKPGEYISDIEIGENPYMTMWIQHIPGTEMIYCRYPKLEALDPIFPE